MESVWRNWQHIRQEILDWYHLKENLYKVGGSLKRLKAAETFLWQGQLDLASALFEKSLHKILSAILKSIQDESLTTSIFLKKVLCSIGSGAVESAVKQIGKRLKISGAQWKWKPQMLQLRSISMVSLLPDLFCKVS